MKKKLKTRELQESYNKWITTIETSIKTAQRTKKNHKEIYERAVKNTQKIEARIFNCNRTSRKDSSIRQNKNIERTCYRKI